MIKSIHVSSSASGARAIYTHSLKKIFILRYGFKKYLLEMMTTTRKCKILNHFTHMSTKKLEE
jgi:uncharacterized protein YdeI (YjbR/CyaY-like superfamily)